MSTAIQVVEFTLPTTAAALLRCHVIIIEGDDGHASGGWDAQSSIGDDGRIWGLSR